MLCKQSKRGVNNHSVNRLPQLPPKSKWLPSDNTWPQASDKHWGAVAVETSAGNVRAPCVDQATTSNTSDAERHELNLRE